MPFVMPNGKPKEAIFRGGGEFQSALDGFLPLDLRGAHSGPGVTRLMRAFRSVSRRLCLGMNVRQIRCQRREPAADDVGFVSERIGWLPFAALCGLAAPFDLLTSLFLLPPK
jgi:hypothetical protein